MNARNRTLAILLFLTGLVCQTFAQQALPPAATKKPTELKAHGEVRVDEYYWMNNRNDPAVIEWLNAENAYTAAMLEPTVGLQKKIAGELESRIPQDDQSVAWPDRGYLWYSRIRKGQQYNVHLRRPVGSDESAEVVVVDVNEIARGHAYCSLAGLSCCTNGQTVAWAVDTVGRRKYTIQFRDMESGAMLPDQIADVTGNIEWAEDNQTIFYTRQDPETLRSHQVYAHRLGTDPASDRLVYEETDVEFDVSIHGTRSRRYLVIDSTQTLSSESRVIDAFRPESEPVVFLPREKNHEYAIDHIGEKFYIRTNWEAPNFRVMETDRPAIDRSGWIETVPHQADVFLDGFELLDDWLVLSQHENGLPRIRYRKWDQSEFSSLDFGEPCYEASLTVTTRTAGNQLRYEFSSLRTPSSVFDYDMKTGGKSLLKQQEVLGGFDTANYVTERLWATAGDGTRVPVALLRHRDTPVDGTAPLLLYAYGSYGSSETDDFSATVLSLVDRGFMYAVAHIRGGQEMGRAWYEDGKLLKKTNTFTDFIDCARFLVAERYADPKRMYAMGGSAGGLLMGAVSNMAPELFHGIIAEVPFVDVITTMLDDSIPLTTSEYDEWGNPNEREYYDYMLSYSPYDNVRALNYPNLLVTTGLHDSQVQYWEPAKWVARLREKKTGNNLLLLHTNMDAGHGGASGREDRYREFALRAAFLLSLAGIEQ